MLLIKYLSMHLKSKMQYKLSFIFILISQFLAMFLEAFVMYSLFNKFKLLNDYNFYELLLGFSVVWLGFSIAEMFGRGFDHFANLIVNGNFDMLIIRPRGIYIQIIGSEIGYEKMSRVLFSLILYVISVVKVVKSYSLCNLLLVITMPIASTIIILSVFIIGATFCFVTVQGIELVNIFTDGTRQVGQYPMSIYNRVIKKVFTFIIPLTLINYYPILYLTKRSSELLYVLMPLMACLFIIPSIIIFNFGMRMYKSSGS